MTTPVNTEKSWIAAIMRSRTRDSPGQILRTIPEAELTKKICLAAVTVESTALKYIPERFQTAKIVDAAFATERSLSIDGMSCMPLAIAHVINPSKMEYLQSIRTTAYAINLVPDEIRDIAFMEQAIRINSLVLAAITHQTPDICMVGVRIEVSGLGHIRIQTRELCLASYMYHGSHDDSRAFQFIRDIYHQKYVARVVIATKLQSLMAVGLSLALLVEVAAATEYAAKLRRMYPKDLLVRGMDIKDPPAEWSFFGEETLSLTELWALADVLRSSC